MTEIEPKSIEGEKKNHLVEFFQKFQSNFPPFNFKRDTEKVVVVEEGTNTKNDEESKQQKPDIVRFANPRQDFSSLKLTIEDADEEHGKSSNHLWQVYALGGFMVARWMWAKWKESKEKPASGDEAPTDRNDS